MKRHTNLLCLGAAVALLNACAPVVNAPEPVLPVPEKKAGGLAENGNLCFRAFRTEYF